MPDARRPPPFSRRVAFGLLLAAPARADSRLAAPIGPVLLSVTGRLSRPNRGAQADFDRVMLEALPRHRLDTATNWTTGVRRFEGPLVRDVLAAAGAEGERVTAVALNDYTIEIPLKDFQDYDVILAMRMDGQVLTVRNKGPVWVVYPRDRHPELRNSLYDSRWIWQLRTLQVR
ncbi:hypothetical protein SAMN02745194_00911 [Roseomonas rosea]|uniref:Oxidoreductase molybdopterin-binding domain-containing protein n=1 Tax=Muricoccus roseus TaxID=198092 RepID=A0A1M6DEI4_9PROT|nr:molybdopterin-dependent oxidoreductase [Roseomonas rosea]SHI71408.1 hypothetical protein SAMN02745194_00911 [Roseomonas rosea]